MCYCREKNANVKWIAGKKICHKKREKKIHSAEWLSKMTKKSLINKKCTKLRCEMLHNKPQISLTVGLQPFWRIGTTPQHDWNSTKFSQRLNSISPPFLFPLLSTADKKKSSLEHLLRREQSDVGTYCQRVKSASNTAAMASKGVFNQSGEKRQKKEVFDVSFCLFSNYTSGKNRMENAVSYSLYQSSRKMHRQKKLTRAWRMDKRE